MNREIYEERIFKAFGLKPCVRCGELTSSQYARIGWFCNSCALHGEKMYRRLTGEIDPGFNYKRASKDSTI